MMRVKVIISRHQNIPGQKHEVFNREGLSVDFTSRIVTVDGEKVDMSPKEYDLLFFMVKNRGIALTREKLIHDVWGYDFYGDDQYPGYPYQTATFQTWALSIIYCDTAWGGISL